VSAIDGSATTFGFCRQANACATTRGAIVKLSSVEIISEYRATLKALRAALRACGDGSNKLTCSTWHYGEQFDFCMLLGKGKIKGALAGMIQHEIEETKRDIEAHGVVVDE
jgi:hypothetical protein